MFSTSHPLYIEDLQQILSYIEFPEGRSTSLLVTGASGMIGSLLVDSILAYNRSCKAAHVQVYALGRRMEKLKKRFNYCELYNQLTLIAQDICESIDGLPSLDFIIHAASPADPLTFSHYPVETIKANTLGMIYCLEYAKAHPGCRVLLLSTGEVYGESVDADAFQESDYGLIDFNSIRSGYPESKRVAELLCRSYWRQYGVDALIARLGYVYGPTMTNEDSRVVAQFIRNILAGENIVIKSAGTQRRSYCYSSDAVAGIFHIMLKGKSGEAYNITNSSSILSIYELASYVAQLNQKTVTFDEADLMERQGFSSAKDRILKEQKLVELKWQPHHDILNGLARTINILKS